jgi:sterol desaturase/sphingolipid hydroxylase (fatty acid hydroxylase superfamily)
MANSWPARPWQKEETMRIFLNIVAVLLILVGIGWFLQGIGVLPGSFMTGQIQWAIYGGIAVVIGIGLLVFANTHKDASTKK